jgi:hypothetical protein
MIIVNWLVDRANPDVDPRRPLREPLSFIKKKILVSVQ